MKLKFYKIQKKEVTKPMFLNKYNSVRMEFPPQLCNYISLTSLSMEWEEKRDKRFVLFYKDKTFQKIEPCLAGVIKKDIILIAPLQCYGTYIVSHYWENYLDIPQHPIEYEMFQYQLTEEYKDDFYEYFIDDRIKISYTLYANYTKVKMISPSGEELVIT